MKSKEERIQRALGILRYYSYTVPRSQIITYLEKYKLPWTILSSRDGILIIFYTSLERQILQQHDKWNSNYEIRYYNKKDQLNQIKSMKFMIPKYYTELPNA